MRTLPVELQKIQTIRLDQWTPTSPGYLWTECGNGDLLRITGIRRDWWAVTRSMSWCCCPDTTLYICATPEEHEAAQTALRNHLAARRENWNRGIWT